MDSPHRGRKAHRLWLAVRSIWTRHVMPHLCPLASLRALECCKSHGSKHGEKAAQAFPPVRPGNKLEQRRQWHPTPVLLPVKSHGRRGLVGCSPWGH